MVSGHKDGEARRGLLRLMAAALVAAIAPALARRAPRRAGEQRRPEAPPAVEARFWRRV